MLTELCKEVFQLAIMTQVKINAMFIELWGAFLAFANVIHGALREIWRNSTRENVSSLVAIGIIVYAFPAVHSILEELLRKNVVLWASGSKIKG